MKISHAIEKLCSFAIMKPKICKFRRKRKLELKALCSLEVVGAVTDRPRREMYEFALVPGEFATFCRRALNERPYIHAATFHFKFQLWLSAFASKSNKFNLNTSLL